MNAPICEPVLVPFVADVLERCNPAQREHLVERAAILEFETAVQPRALAEALAVLDLLHRFPELLTGLVAVEVEIDGVTSWLLASELALARNYLAETDGHELAVCPPGAVLHAQYGGLAQLSVPDQAPNSLT